MATGSLNKVLLIGNLTRDPELRQTGGGQSVCSFGIATNRSWKDASGQKQEQAEFHNIVAWGKLGEICGQYLRKGKKIFIEGRMQTREWEGQDGQKRRTTEVIAENMIMLDRGGAPGGPPAEFSAPAMGSPVPPMAQPPAEEEIRLEDIPF
ncbi:single-stranded DNA-binding protein [Candidatus Uhrbacteria bacterium]|nr:single-stranded DNA-binding protein [Candidatus Uhrbacteria bacterium]